MSIGASFFAIDRYRLRGLVIDPTSVPGYLRTPADEEGPHAQQTVEQAWDVVRSLLPAAVDGEFLEGTGGMGCIYLTASHVERSAARIAPLDMQALARDFASDPDGFAELYWSAFWQENAPRLLVFLQGVQRFFADAAARRDAVVFYIA
ncbi:DUF1877 domain-containing protein [Variovorax sp. KBW07]|uniref:DUF1877 family protein n=1 Tax=Variovorax sp. KBW07 TaxID=2153358 RepID=UPI000F58E449|nr:DUF1877 family protein [Variovorax sp. KBW07]RQO35473.1 DUF1877 domain-containing protein [Variovorax sp. KBW07]